MGKFQTSWRLVQASWRVLRADPELLILPVLSGFCITVVLTAFGAVGFLETTGASVESGQTPWLAFALGWLATLVACFIGLFCNTALVACTMIRLEGGQPTLGDGLRVAASRAGSIFGYAVLTVTVGMVLRAIEDRLGFIGRIVSRMFGAAWAVACFLVVPILVVENVGPMDAVRHSARLLKKSWGENVVGHAGINMVVGLAFTVSLVVGGGLAVVLFSRGQEIAGLAAAGLTAAMITAVLVLGSALNGIYAAVLYRYASGGRVPPGFDDESLRLSFSRK